MNELISALTELVRCLDSPCNYPGELGLAKDAAKRALSEVNVGSAFKDAIVRGTGYIDVHASAMTALRAAPTLRERDAFERWALREYALDYMPERFASGRYKRVEIQRDWETWQARAALAHPPEGAQPEPAFVPAELENWSRSQDAAQALPDLDPQVFGLPFSEAKKRILEMSELDVRGLAISLLIRAEGAQTLPAADAHVALTDDQLMRAIVNACDSLNITRVHEVGGKTRTICEEAGLLEIGRAVLAAALPTPPNAQETKT